MTRKEIDDIFQEYGQYATGKDYALVHAVVAAVSLRCVCGEPNSAGTHRTDGPCLAPQPKKSEQEPVAWIDASSFAMMHQDPRFDRVQWQTTLTLSKVYEGQMPLYTIPPQRTWVGLTDEDVRQCSRDVAAGGKENCVDRFAYAIEAKLKEKNA